MATIPVEVDELTPAWFTDVLDRHAPGVSVSAVEVVDSHSGTTGRVRVRLAHDAGAAVPQHLFVKLAPFDPRQREFLQRVGIGVAEARLYASVGNELPVRVPRCWHAAFDDDRRFVMVLEDLVDAGCGFPRPRDADVDERAARMVEDLARLHAAYWESGRFAGDLDWVPERAGFGGGGRDARAAAAAGGFIRRALDEVGHEMSPAARAVGTWYVDRAADVLDLWDEGERTLIHGDAHMGNLFVDGDRPGFFDWAMASRSPGMRDVAYYVCTSVPTDVRRSIEDDLLDRYLRTLATGGVTLDPATARYQYRMFAVYAWVSSTSTAVMGSRWQPLSVSRGGVARSTAAIEDLDSAGLLADRLG